MDTTSVKPDLLDPSPDKELEEILQLLRDGGEIEFKTDSPATPTPDEIADQIEGLRDENRKLQKELQNEHALHQSAFIRGSVIGAILCCVIMLFGVVIDVATTMPIADTRLP